MADVLETDAAEISLDTDFRDAQYDWDSLKGYAVLVMLEDAFGKSMPVDDFLEAKTIGDLLAFVQRQA